MDSEGETTDDQIRGLFARITKSEEEKRAVMSQIFVAKDAEMINQPACDESSIWDHETVDLDKLGVGGIILKQMFDILTVTDDLGEIGGN